jgi:uncharacterized protein YggE
VDRPPAHLRIWLPLGLALLLLAVPGGALAAERTVSVTGKATLEVPNDTARVGFGVSAERRSKGAALRAASARLRKVIAAAQTIPGVGAGDIRTGSISVRKVERGKQTTYRSGQGITVTLHEPDRAGELVSAAVAAGASGVRGPSFFIGDTEAAYGKALAAAFEKARAKAQLLAAQAGAVLGPALTIAESGGVEATPVSSPESKGTTAEEEAPPSKPSTSTVTASVNVVFSLE